MDKRKQFVRDLVKLCENYGATLSASDEYEGYPECGEDIQITAGFDYPFGDVKFGEYVTINAEYEDNYDAND